MLVPNEGVLELPIRPRTAVSVPSDLGFRLLARPPYGATRIKAIVTKAPLPLAGSANRIEGVTDVPTELLVLDQSAQVRVGCDCTGRVGRLLGGRLLGHGGFIPHPEGRWAQDLFSASLRLGGA
jgi:hypothetical protein